MRTCNFIRMPRARDASLMIMAVAFATASGCGAGNIRVADEPTFSKLTGRWSTSVSEVFNKYWKGVGHEITPKPGGIDDRIVFVTVRPDGRIDWSRSYIGLEFGWCDLAEIGDECAGSWNGAGPFKVVAATYSPTRTSITIKGLPPSGASPDADGHGTLDVELNPDGSATLRLKGGFQHLIEQKGVFEARLERHDRLRRVVDNASSIAGKWVDEKHKNDALMVIRKDGTFDWAGTMFGCLGFLHQLEFPGDRSTPGGDRTQNTLVSAEYHRNESAITVRITGQILFAYQEFKCRARRIGVDRLELSIKYGGTGIETLKKTRTLCRNNQATKRSDPSAFGGE